MRDQGHRHLSDSVSCLACRHVYEKPMRGGTASRNPGCPRCGYVGWLSLLEESAAPAAPMSLGHQGATSAA